MATKKQEKKAFQRRQRETIMHRVSIMADTPIVPAILGDVVVAHFRHDGTEEQRAQCRTPAIDFGLTQHLEWKAERLYKVNENFAIGCRRSGNGGREYLEAFMRHWAESWLKREARTPGEFEEEEAAQV